MFEFIKIFYKKHPLIVFFSPVIIFIIVVLFIVLSDDSILSGFLPLILICFIILALIFLMITVMTGTKKSGTIKYLAPLFIVMFMVMIIWIFQPRMRDDFAIYQFNPLYAYTHFSGRFSHIFINSIALMNNITFDIFKILRSLMFFFCIYLSLVISSGKWLPATRQSIISFLLVFSALWLGIGNILAPSISIVSGSTTYLYSVFFCLLFLLPYRFHLKAMELNESNNSALWALPCCPKGLVPVRGAVFRRVLNLNIALSIGFFVFGMISSGFHEQMSLPVLFFIAVWFFTAGKEKRPLWLYAGAAGFLIGTIISFTAPGNFSRLGNEQAYTLNLSLSGIENKVSNYLIYLKKLYFDSIREKLLPYLLIFVALSMKLHPEKNKEKGLFYRFTFEIWLIFSLLSTWPFLFISPDSWGADRTYFIPLFLLILSFASLLNNREQNSFNGGIFNILFFALFIVLSIDGIDCLQKGYMIGSVWHNREKKIEEYKASGVFNAVVDPYPDPPRTIYINDITTNTNLSWDNEVPASYYKLKTIRLRIPR